MGSAWAVRRSMWMPALLVVFMTACSLEASRDDSASGPELEAVMDQVTDYAEPLIEKWGVPSVAIGIVTESGLDEARFFGENLAGDAVDATTLFEIGSTSKAFLGVTEALLVDAGELSWSDRVIDHYPDFRLHDPWVAQEFRISDLLAQRSGLAPYAADLLGHLGYPYETAISALEYIEPASSFRSEFAYQNIPHLIAGNIVAEKVGAETWGDAAESLVFEPLQMRSTFVDEHALESSSNTTAGHEMFAGEIRALKSGRFPTEAQGAGGIVSNLEDMSHWVAMHLSQGTTSRGKFLSSEALEETYQPRVAVTGAFAEGMKQGEGTPNIGYATGWLVHALPEGRVIEHGGTTNGYTSSVRFDPDRRVGVVVLTNLSHQGGLATPIAQYAIDLLQEREPVDYEARVQRMVTENESKAVQKVDPTLEPSLDDFTGVYTHPVAGEIEVALVGDELMTVIGPRDVDVRFERLSSDAFTLHWLFDNDPEAWHLTAPAMFTGNEGRPDGILIGDLAFVRR